jgi:hypothetical protein
MFSAYHYNPIAKKCKNLPHDSREKAENAISRWEDAKSCAGLLDVEMFFGCNFLGFVLN